MSLALVSAQVMSVACVAIGIRTAEAQIARTRTPSSKRTQAFRRWAEGVVENSDALGKLPVILAGCATSARASKP